MIINFEKEQEIKLINRIIEEAIYHGGDLGANGKGGDAPLPALGLPCVVFILGDIPVLLQIEIAAMHSAVSYRKFFF